MKRSTRRWGVLVGLAIALTLSPSNFLFANDEVQSTSGARCEPCKKQLALYRQNEQQISESTEFLGKNREYLTLLSPKEASKFLKVGGNIQSLLEKIDSLKTENVRLENQMKEAGCDACTGDPS